MGALVGVMESRFLDGFEVTDRTRELLTANGWTERTILWTLGEIAGLPDGTVFRTAEGGVFEVKGGRIVRTHSMTWWSPLVSWLPITVLYSSSNTETRPEGAAA